MLVTELVMDIDCVDDAENDIDVVGVIEDDNDVDELYDGDVVREKDIVGVGVIDAL